MDTLHSQKSRMAQVETVQSLAETVHSSSLSPCTESDSEKVNYYIEGAEMKTTSDSPHNPDYYPAHKMPRLWQPTIFRLAPLTGISCMLLAILSLLVSLAILICSNGVPVRNWSVYPSAYIAVCTAIANQAIRFAAFQGFVVAWWVRASRGSTLVSRSQTNGDTFS
jgi:hypothetical protein